MIKHQTGKIPRSDGKVQRKDGVWTTPKKKHVGVRKYNPGAGGADSTKTTDISTGSSKSFSLFMAKYFKNHNYKINYNLHDFQAVIKTLNEYYIQYALDTGNFVLLPNGLGKFGVRKFKRALRMKSDGRLNLAVDWGEYKKTGQISYFTNQHTDGNSFRWIWVKDDCKLINPNEHRNVNHTMYRFKTVNKAKEALTNYITNGGNWEKFNYTTDSIKEHLILKRMGRKVVYANRG